MTSTSAFGGLVRKGTCWSSYRVSLLGMLFSSGLVLFCFFCSSEAFGVPLKGSNGTTVDFFGIKSASPAGLRVQVADGGALLDVAWEKFDIEQLRIDHPEIFAAFEEAKAGKHTELNLGSFAPKVDPAMREVKNFRDGAERDGWYEAGAGGGKFAIQLPKTEPKAILLVSMGQDGRSIRYMGGVGTTRWNAMMEKFQMAVLSYEFSLSKGGENFDPAKNAPFIFTEAGSGDALFEALGQLSEKSGKSGLKDLPIAIFGNDVLGAAFAYNLVQSHPDRIIAAVASKGAFYLGKPTEASVKVPLLLLWGEYDQDIDRWSPSDTHEEVYETALPLQPNWIHAMEPRGGPGESQLSFQISSVFLDRMILARLKPEGELVDLERDGSWIGNLETREIRRMEDPERVLEPHETWLPNGEVAKLWEEFSNGTLAPDTQ